MLKKKRKEEKRKGLHKPSSCRFGIQVKMTRKAIPQILMCHFNGPGREPGTHVRWTLPSWAFRHLFLWLSEDSACSPALGAQLTSIRIRTCYSEIRALSHPQRKAHGRAMLHLLLVLKVQLSSGLCLRTKSDLWQSLPQPAFK